VEKKTILCTVLGKETYTCEKRPVNVGKDLQMWKETCKYEKRPINVKRDVYV